MASDQEVAALRERVAQFEGQEVERTKAAAVAAELSKYEFVSPAAADQVSALVGPSVRITRTNEGRDLIFGPDYRPLEAHVADLMAQPSYAHYLRPKGSSASASAQAGPQGQQPAAPATLDQDGRLPGENLGMAAIRRAMEQRPVVGDPRLNTSQPMGLGRSSLPPK
jgi:hypothetical protein